MEIKKLKLSDIIVSEEETILFALKKLNKLENISNLILFVVDNNRRMIGTITDGDIRRSIIKHQSLNLKIGKICNKDFRFSYENEKINFSKLRLEKIKILPILNKEKIVLDFIDLLKFKSITPLECVLMAGGRGKRLSPLTDAIPKPLLKLGNKPIIEYNIDNLIRHGVSKFYITINYLGSMIKDYFGDGSKKGVSIEYIEEKEFYGTAGSVSLINNITTDHICIMNSDLFTNINIETLYNESIDKKTDITVASIPYNVDVPYAVIESHNYKVESFKEKPSYRFSSNAGVYILKKSLIKKIPKNTMFDMTDLMDLVLSENGNIMHVPVTGYWVDIGKPSDYERAKELVKFISDDK